MTTPLKETHAAPYDFAQTATVSSTKPLTRPANYASLFHETLKDQPHRDIPQATQPYRDFATHGHAESDRNLAALAEREAAEALQRYGEQLDEENFAALFNDPGDSVLINQTKEMKLVHTKPDGKGGNRSVWKGTYNRSTQAHSTSKEEPSLLD